MTEAHASTPQPTNAQGDPTPVHVFFVLDRSGSMQLIGSDVIGGFNAFLEEQQRTPGECRMTLIQFDTVDAHEVLAEGLPIREVCPLDAGTFLPRGGTPLYDAMGHAIADAKIRSEQRQSAGEQREEIIFVTFTDGLENSSAEYDREQIFSLIRKQEAEGWTFAYLGANQDAYAEGGRIGYRATSSQNFFSNSEGVRRAMSSSSRSLRRRREKIARGEKFDNKDFFEGDKPAEDNMESPSN